MLELLYLSKGTSHYSNAASLEKVTGIT